MSLGEWASKLAGDDDDLRLLLTGVPGPMCPKIDKWVGKPYRPAQIDRRVGYSDDESGVDSLYADAERIRDERDTAIDGLEECRTALDALRDALVNAVELIKESRATPPQTEEPNDG